MKTICLAISLFVLSVMNVFACSCVEELPSAADTLRMNHQVFLGVPNENSKQVNAETYKTSFTVVSNFKNASATTQTIYSGKDDGAGCGVSFSKNAGVILLRTEKYQGKKWVSMCSIDFVNAENKELTVLVKNLAKMTK